MGIRLRIFSALPAMIAGLCFCMSPAVSQNSNDFETGAAAYESGQYGDAIAIWQPLADRGNIDALNMLAQIHRLGLGVQQDDRKAYDLYSQAAEAGSAEAQVNVAFMLLTGKGVTRTPDKAAGWFAKAADQGNALAQYNLGLMYEKGIGVNQDLEFAAELYRIAADKGQKRALARLEALEADEPRRIAEKQVAQKAQAEAAAKAEEPELAPEKAERSPALSITRVDDAKDSEALPSYTSSAEESTAERDRPLVNVVRTPNRSPGQTVSGAPKGDEPDVIIIPDGQEYSDDGAVIVYAPPPPAPPETTKTPEPLVSSITAATPRRSNPGDPAARIRMAESAYRNGKFDEATSLLIPLANAGMPVAQFWLGRLYNRGEGVVLNRAEAYSLWRSAAAGGSEQAATALANLTSRLSPEEINFAEQRHAASGRAR